VYIDPLIPVVSREGFEASHIQLANQVSAELRDLVKQTEDIFKACFHITKDGHVSPEERADLEREIAEVEASIIALAQKMDTARGAVTRDRVSIQTTGENYMVYTATTIAKMATKRARGVLDGDHPADSVISAIKGDIQSVFDRSVITSADHLRWVFRNTLSLALCFWLGYIGWGPGCTKPGRSCFIRPYNASLATLVVVLLSKFIGSTFKSALDRLAAVTLANVIGQLLYVLLGWCTLWGRTATAIFIFLVVLPNMHVAFSGGTYASLGVRLAAISAMWLLTPCSDEYITKSQYADLSWDQRYRRCCMYHPHC
jgi:hypothetical protein